MSIERTNRLRIALQKAKAGLPEAEEQRSDNPSKLGRLLKKPSKEGTKGGFLQSQPIHERPVLGAISKEVLGDDVTYEPAIQLDQVSANFSSVARQQSKKILNEEYFKDTWNILLP